MWKFSPEARRMRPPFKVAAWVLCISMSLGVLIRLPGACLDLRSDAADLYSKGVSWMKSRQHLDIEYRFDSGQVISHDLFMTNASGKDLSDVHMSFEVLGDNGPSRLERYWPDWPIGGTKHVQIPVSKIRVIYRIVVDGRTDQGVLVHRLSDLDRM